jgi:hypothetical protein
MPHLAFEEFICNRVVAYLHSHRESGIDCLDAVQACAQACAHTECKFWPCNQKISAASLQQSVVTVVADQNVDFVPLVAVQAACKVEMKVSSPLLFAAWCDRRYSQLETEVGFREKFHTDYLAWNTVGVTIIRGVKVALDEAEDIAEVEHADHRLEFADYLAAVLGITLSEDPRVIGCAEAAQIITHNREVFGEYIRTHWNFAGRSEVIGPIMTFHQWLSSHPTYSKIYRLFRNGQSWKDAKKALKGVGNRVTHETFNDWDSAEYVTVAGCVHDDDTDVLPADELMKALHDMSSATAVAEAPREKVYGASKKSVKMFLPSKAPSFLEGTVKSDRIFVCRHSKGAFEIYIKLAKMLEASDATDVSEIWSKFRPGPGTASFVTAGREMFLCISGTIKKKPSGFYEMFEKFPGFIAALQKKQYFADGRLSAVPVVMDKFDGAPYTYFASTKKKCIVKETKVAADAVELSDDDESDDGCNYYDFGSGKVAARAAAVVLDDDCGFEFREASSEAAVELDSRYETDAYFLVDILVRYFKK